MNLSQLTVSVKNKKVQRVGRGTGSGMGKTSTRGHKGAGQRKGKKLPYIGFRGGNIPYVRKIPKRGFTSVNAKTYQIVNLKEIVEKLSKEKEINPNILKTYNMIKDENKPVKILAKKGENFTLSVNFTASKFSANARRIIEEAGGRITNLSSK